MASELLGEKAVYLRLEAPWIAETARPGQFVMVTCRSDTGALGDPLLGRPLALAGVKDSEIELVLARVGRGTEWLARQRPGDPIKVRGPLGNTFEPVSSGRVLIAGGGVGMAPLLYLSQAYEKEADVEVIFGIPDRSWKPVADLMTDRIPWLKVTSDDGSFGIEGNPCTIMGNDYKLIQACGPIPMMAGILNQADPETELQFSLEARMGCGYGGCFGCVLPTHKGLLRTCSDGPIFDGREVIWDELA